MSLEKIKQLREFVQKEDSGADVNLAAKSIAEIMARMSIFSAKTGRSWRAATVKARTECRP